MVNLNEGYLFSDKTISVDLHKFENGECGLFVIGLAGSGKTTLGNILSKKHNIKVRSTDECIDEPDHDSYIKCVKKIIIHNKNYILEGVGVAEAAFVDKNITNLIKNSSCIFMGLSVVRSNYRSFMRRYKKTGKMKPLHMLHINNLQLFERQLSKLRKDCLEGEKIIKNIG